MRASMGARRCGGGAKRASLLDAARNGTRRGCAAARVRSGALLPLPQRSVCVRACERACVRVCVCVRVCAPVKAHGGPIDLVADGGDAGRGDETHRLAYKAHLCGGRAVRASGTLRRSDSARAQSKLTREHS